MLRIRSVISGKKSLVGAALALPPSERAQQAVPLHSVDSQIIDGVKWGRSAPAKLKGYNASKIILDIRCFRQLDSIVTQWPFFSSTLW
jgi:hypothetical protein